MADESVVYLILLVEVSLLALFVQVLPGWTRQDIFFAITVPAEFRGTEMGRAILRAYRIESVVYALMAAALILGGMAAGILGIALAGLGWQIAGLVVAFLRARRKARPHAAAPDTVREAEIGPRAAETGVARLLQWAFPVPLLALAGVALYLRRNWARIPDRFPTHWNAAGVANGWSERTIEGVYGGLVLGAVFCGVLWLAAFAVLRWSRRISASGPAAAQEDRFRLAAATVLFVTSLFVACLMAWIAILPLRPHSAGPPSMAWIVALSVVFTVAVLMLLVRNRPGRVAAASGAPAGDRTADRYWKAGLFYVNPNDPALLIEKRFGIGYTLNLGHRWTWLLLAILLGGPSLAIVLLRML
jgi:uncharacterized membrane protein